MKRLVWLVRHAERADLKGDIGWSERAREVGADPFDAPLTESGRKQAAHAATLIHSPLRHVYSSPFLRCRETADIIASAHSTGQSISTDLTEWMNPEWFQSAFTHFNEIHFRKYEASFVPGYPKIPEKTEECLVDRWMRIYTALVVLPANKFPLALVSHGNGIHHMMNRHAPAVMSGKSVQVADVYRMEL